MKVAEGFIEGKAEGGYVIKAGEEKVLAKRLIVATGSMPTLPPIQGLKENLEAGVALTNREILNLTEIPKKLAVVGGGVIGLEMASYFSSVGSEVTVIEMLDKIAGPTEKECSAILQKALERKGVKFNLGAKVTSIEKDGVVYEKDGKVSKVEADKILLSIGRRAVTAGIGLENIGVNLERGAIVTDDQMKTNVANVYAVGDVNGKVMLAHTAYRESEVAIAFLKERYELSKVITDSTILDKVVFGDDTIAKIKEECSLSTPHLQTILNKLKQKKIIVDNRLNQRYIPNTDFENGMFKMMLLFEIQ
jgi:dihydrolipoamide dehydrogenase